MTIITQLADEFTQLFYNKAWPGEFEPSVSELSIDDAYTIQDKVAAKRVERGESVVGYKVGCTSDAIRKQFGLSEPISARLFHPWGFDDGATLDFNYFANCAIEPEMVIPIGADLHGEGLSDGSLIYAIEYVSVGIELHHYTFWFSPPSVQELICSGGIHAGLVVGQARVSPKELSFETEMFSVRKDGELITQGPASEIMGGPLVSLRWLIDSLTHRGESLKQGSLVIPGSPVELVCIDNDTELSVAIDGVGEVAVYFRSKLS